MSYAAGLGALAGPLHGLANQEVLGWIKVKEDVANCVAVSIPSPLPLPPRGQQYVVGLVESLHRTDQRAFLLHKRRARLLSYKEAFDNCRPRRAVSESYCPRLDHLFRRATRDSVGWWIVRCDAWDMRMLLRNLPSQR